MYIAEVQVLTYRTHHKWVESDISSAKSVLGALNWIELNWNQTDSQAIILAPIDNFLDVILILWASMLLCGSLVLTGFTMQEEYIKEEQRNLKRELLRAQEEVRRIQSVPLVIGQFLEMVDNTSGIVGSTTGKILLMTSWCNLYKSPHLIGRADFRFLHVYFQFLWELISDPWRM